MPFPTRRSPEVRLLARYFRDGGYVRRQDPHRLPEGYERYKKGDEVRLVLPSRQDLRAVRALLHGAGFIVGAPFRKGRQICQPVYGRAAVARFLKLIGVHR